MIRHSGEYSDVLTTHPLKEGVEDGAVRLGLLRGVAQSVSGRQQGDKTRDSTLRSWSNVKEEGPAVQLQRGDKGKNEIH